MTDYPAHVSQRCAVYRLHAEGQEKVENTFGEETLDEMEDSDCFSETIEDWTGEETLEIINAS